MAFNFSLADLPARVKASWMGCSCARFCQSSICWRTFLSVLMASWVSESLSRILRCRASCASRSSFVALIRGVLLHLKGFDQRLISHGQPRLVGTGSHDRTRHGAF